VVRKHTSSITFIGKGGLTMTGVKHQTSSEQRQ
jgi:hypothetical protein